MKAIIEIGRPFTNTDMVNYAAGVWYMSIVGITGFTDDYNNLWYYENQNTVKYDVQSVQVDGIIYNQAVNLAELYQQDKMFYYDNNTTRLYVAFESYKKYKDFKVINIAITLGYCYGQSGLYINNIYYEPRLLDIYNINKKKDPLFFGVIIYSTGSVELANGDGEFDEWNKNYYYNNVIKIKYSEDGTNWQVVGSGVVGNNKITYDKFMMEVFDSRHNLENSFIKNRLSKNDYPYLSEDGAIIPRCYNKAIKVEPICLNEEQSGNKIYKFVDTTDYEATSLIVYDGNNVITPVSYDLTAGTFELTETQAEGEINCTFEVNSVKNGVDIIIDILTNDIGIPFNSIYFDVDEVNYAKSLCRNTSVYVDDDKKTIEVIKQICIDCDLIFFVKNDGRYTIRIFEEDKAVSHEIDKNDLLDEPQITEQFDQFLSSVVVKYAQDHYNERWQNYENNNYKDEVFQKYKAYKTKEVETGLLTEADAQAKSETIMALSKDTIRLVDIRLPYNKYKDIELADYVQGRLLGRTGEVTKRQVFEVISIKANILENILDLTLRYVKDLPALIEYKGYKSIYNNNIITYDKNTNDIINLSGINYYDSTNYNSANYGPSSVYITERLDANINVTAIYDDNTEKITYIAYKDDISEGIEKVINHNESVKIEIGYRVIFKIYALNLNCKAQIRLIEEE